MSRWRLAARLARRELRARPWRTLLIALMVAVPVMGMVVAATVVRTGDAPYDDRYGTADAVVRRYGAALRATSEPFDPAAAVPGARAARLITGSMNIRPKVGNNFGASVVSGDVASPLASGAVHVLSGRLPTAADEVAMSPAARRKLGVRVGDTVALKRPAFALRVVGSAVVPYSYNGTLLVLAGTREIPGYVGFSDESFIDLPRSRDLAALQRYVNATNAAAGAPSTPIQFSNVLSLRSPFLEPTSYSGSSRQTAVNWTFVAGALLLLVIGIVISAAFAVGARRQLHTIGLLASNGAEPSTTRRVLLTHGAFCGATGVVLGFALGGIVLAAGAPHRNRLLGQVIEAWDFRAGDLVPIAVIGVMAAIIAAAQPARAASRVSVSQALGGQRPAGRVPPWMAPVGVALFLSGLGLLALVAADNSNLNGSGWTLTAIAGGVAVLLGTTASAPLVVARLEPLANRLRGTWRLAARSLARQRSRTSGVIAAVAAAAAVTLVIASVSLAAVNDNPTQALPDDVVVVRGPEIFDRTTPTLAPTQRRPVVPASATVEAAARIVRARSRAIARSVPVGVGLFATGGLAHAGLAGVGPAAVATPELISFLGAGREATKAIARGQAVIVDPTAPRGRTVANLFENLPGPPDTTRQPFQADVLVVGGTFSPAYELPNLLLPQRIFEQLGVQAHDVVLLRAPGALSRDQRDRLRALDDQVIDGVLEENPAVTLSSGGLRWNQPSGDVPLGVIHASMVGLALIFTLLVIAIGLGLAASEGRAERDVLVAVGAPPRALSHLAGYKATTIALVGVLLAIPTAMLPVWVAASSANAKFRMPWLVTGLLVFAVPVIAGAVTTGASALGARLHPARATAFSQD